MDDTHKVTHGQREKTRGRERTSAAHALTCPGMAAVRCAVLCAVLVLCRVDPVVPAADPFSHASRGSMSLTSPALAAIHAERRESSEVNTLVDSDEALTALHLLSKFIRMNRNKMDAATSKAVAVLDSTELASNPEEALRGGVGAGLKLGEHKHKHDKDGKDGAEHKHGSKGHSHDHHAGDSHDEAFLIAQGGKLYHSIWQNISAAWADDVLRPERHHALSAEEKERHRQCMDWVNTHNVKVDAGWGTLPPALYGRFDELRCSDIASLEKTAQYIQAHKDMYDHVLPVPEDRQRVKAEPGMEDKVIATIVCMTTRSLTINRPEDLALFKNLLPTFASTVEPGFEYWFYIGYDKGDPWLDNADHLAVARDFFQRWVSDVLAKRGIVAKLVFSTWVNPYHKPGPAFNFVTGVAYADGATYIYRINDDQSFDSPWAKAMVDALTAMGPPYGVVGPACGEGATHILVVDFVHRTHHEIFPTHYPPSLMAWWMDNCRTTHARSQRASERASA